MQIILQIGQVFLLELLWNLGVWIPTAIVSLLFIRVMLGIHIHELVAEVEEHQTAAVGAVFFWVSLGFSLLVGRAVGDPATPTQDWSTALIWLGLGFVVVLLMFVLGVLVVFGTLAKRRQETILAYIQRELRQEHNLALSLIMGSLFLVPVVLAYHLTV